MDRGHQLQSSGTLVWVNEGHVLHEIPRHESSLSQFEQDWDIISIPCKVGRSGT